MKQPLGLRLRLTLWFVAILGAALCIFAALAYLLLSRGLYGGLDASLEVMARQINTVLESEDGQSVNVSDEVGDIVHSPSDVLMLYSGAGQPSVLWGHLIEGVQGLDSLVAQAAAGRTVAGTLRAADGTRLRMLAAPLSDEPGTGSVVVAGSPTTDVEAVLSRFRRVAIAATLVTVGVASAGGVFLANRALQPVGAMARTAEEIEASDLSRRIVVRSNDELGRLAMTLNQMFARLETTFGRMRQFTSDASHELRTPLAVIQAEATLALRRRREEAAYRETLRVISRESAYMSDVLGRLLQIARMDQAASSPLRERLSLGNLMTDVLGGIELIASEQGLRIDRDGIEQGMVRGDPVELRQVLVILLDNALKFTPRGGTVTVSVKTGHGSVVASVSDTGVGIPPEHLTHVFEDFYRVDPARSRALGGTGLGLAIARRIVDAHEGRIEVESEEGRGTLFRVILPAAPDTQLC